MGRTTSKCKHTKEVISLIKRDLNKLVLNYLVIQGHKEAVEKFILESGISLEVDQDCIQVRREVRSFIESGNIDEAIHAVNQIDVSILDSNPKLLFHLQQLKLIHLLKNNNVMAALDFAQSDLSKRALEFPELLPDLEQTMALFAFDSCNNYLLDTPYALEIAGELNSAILKAQCQDENPKLPGLLKMLVWAQEQLEERCVFPVIKDLATAEFM